MTKDTEFKFCLLNKQLTKSSILALIRAPSSNFSLSLNFFVFHLFSELFAKTHGNNRSLLRIFCQFHPEKALLLTFLAHLHVE